MKAEAPSPQTTLVIMLGASEWPYAPDFHGTEAFANSASDFRKYFLNPRAFNLPIKNLLDLFNSNLSSDDIDREIGQFLAKRLSEMKESNSDARDVIIYFVGHGGFAGSDLDYYLAIRRTRMENPIASSLRIVTLAHTLKENARYLRRIIILDCCFAASASIFFQSSEPAQAAMIQAIDAFKVGEKGSGLPGRGTSLLCSSRHNIPSLISLDGRYTMFSEALLHVLNYGNPGLHDFLTLRTVARLTEDFLRDTPGGEAPRPEVHSPNQSEGDVADVPCFPNTAADSVEVPKSRDIWHTPEEFEDIEHQTRVDQNKGKSFPKGITRRRTVLGIFTLLAGSALLWEIFRSHTTSHLNIEDKCYTSSTVYTGHSNAVWYIAWALNGLSIASGGADHTVQIWYAANGRKIHTYNGHQPYSIRSVAWSPDSTLLVSGGRDLIVRVWKASDGKPVSTFHGHKDVVTAVAWSPNGAYIASTSLDKTVAVWEALTGNIVFIYRGHSDTVSAVAWANDSMHIASASVDKTVQVWNAITGKQICIYRDHANKVWGVTWSSDGKFIASAGEDKIVRVWQVIM